MDHTLDSRRSRRPRTALLRAALAVALLGLPGPAAAQLVRSYALQTPVTPRSASSSVVATQPTAVVTTAPAAQLPEPDTQPGECSDLFQEASDACQAGLADAANLCAAYEAGLFDRWCAWGADCSRFRDACWVASTANAQCFEQAFAEFSACEGADLSTRSSWMEDSNTAALTWMALSTLASSSSETYQDLEAIRRSLE